MEPIISPAGPGDAPALLAVYRPYVEKTAVTFEYRVPTEEEFAGRVRHVLERYPYLKAEADGELVGYAYASRFKDRAAYAWSVETSIYVKEGFHGKGIGRALYRALEGALQRQNVQNLNACIAFPNPESIAFHERMGYALVAHFHQCGFKNGQWWDMVWMEKALGAHEPSPRDFIPHPLLDGETPETSAPQTAGPNRNGDGPKK